MFSNKKGGNCLLFYCFNLMKQKKASLISEAFFVIPLGFEPRTTTLKV